MLIQKILGRNKIQDYSFAKYKLEKGNEISLVLFKGHGNYYDLINHRDIYFTQIQSRELLIKYAQANEKWISKSKAIKLAKPYYGEFKEDLINEYENEELINQ